MGTAVRLPLYFDLVVEVVLVTTKDKHNNRWKCVCLILERFQNWQHLNRVELKSRMVGVPGEW